LLRKLLRFTKLRHCRPLIRFPVVLVRFYMGHTHVDAIPIPRGSYLDWRLFRHDDTDGTTCSNTQSKSNLLRVKKFKFDNSIIFFHTYFSWYFLFLLRFYLPFTPNIYSQTLIFLALMVKLPFCQI
jgi:hypothetical protein